MSFDKKLKNALNDIEIPEELMPSNIEAMLRAVAPVQETDTTAEQKRSNITVKRTNRTIMMRTLAAAAACVALAGGFIAFKDVNNTQPMEIEEEIDYEAVQVQSYDELYNIYTGIYLKNSGESTGAENGDGVEIITDETAITDNTETASPVTEPAITEAVQQETETKPAEAIETVRSDFSDADIVKSDETSIYYICNGVLYVVDKGTMTVKSQIENENPPFEMFVRGNSLVLVSNENTSDQSDSAEDNVVIDIYDTSSGELAHIKTYKQNGTYTSARVDENAVMYLVTGYSDYRADPLDENAELESYVPGYYIDGEKHYVAAEDISVPSGANNTDYTVVSAIKCSDPVNISVKAVLGSSTNAYCSDDTLYVAGTGVKDNKDYTAITSFTISESGLSYKAAAVLEGELISSHSMAESGGLFRAACRQYDENGMIVTDIYSMDEGLNVVNTVDSLLPGVIVSSVKYDDCFASVIERNSAEPMLVIDLNQSSTVSGDNANSFSAAYVSRFSENEMLGISAVQNEDGTYSSLRLEMYDSSGTKINEVAFAELTNVMSPALSDKNALLVDYDNNVIGVPVSAMTDFGITNRYYVFSYTPENGFAEKGVIEYNDIDDNYKFERAVIDNGTLIIIGSGRIVSVQLSDMTVVSAFDF